MLAIYIANSLLKCMLIRLLIALLLRFFSPSTEPVSISTDVFIIVLLLAHLLTNTYFFSLKSKRAISLSPNITIKVASKAISSNFSNCSFEGTKRTSSVSILMPNK